MKFFLKHKDTKTASSTKRFPLCVPSCLRVFVVKKKHQVFKLFVTGIAFSFFFSFNVFSQPSPSPAITPDTTSVHEPRSSEYDEILIILNVSRIGTVEIPAVIYGEIAYLPIKEIFDFLKIRNNVSADLLIVDGFFIDPKATYSIDKTKREILYNGKAFPLQADDIIITQTGFYLRSGIFGQVFGLDCQFSFRNLTVNLVTNVELPALREMKIEAMRRNLNQLKGERKADTIINRKFSLLKLGMLDWSVISTQDKAMNSNTRVTLGIGGIILGGETDIFLNYYNDRALNLKDQYYFWRYINNDLKALKQVTVGKILANPSSTVFDGIVGIQVNNTPTTFRRSFGTYTLSDKTEPGWTVELYVNNVLINYTKADATGFFTFEVPMVYGNSVVRLKFYGPWGEEIVREQNHSVPFNFLPQGQFEYSVNAGVVEDRIKSKFSRTQFNYGLNKRITIGGGMEYLSSVSPHVMPFVNASVRLGSNVFITGEHIHQVRSKGLASFRLPSNLRLEFNYIRYNKDQKAIMINYLDEKKLVLSKPFRGDKFSGFSRFTLNQFTLSNIAKKTKFTSAELLMSAVAFGISSNLTNFVILRDEGIPLAFSNLTMTYRFRHGFNILPQVQYEYNLKKFSLIKMEVEKSLFNRGFMNISCERDVKNGHTIFGLGMRYNMSIAQFSVSTRRSKKISTTTEVARGSILYDGKSGYLGLSNQNNVGRGGLIVAPYLDMNCNGKRDKGEPAAPGLKVKVSGGRIQRNLKDTTVRVTNLDAYTGYYVELDKNSFDNIAWQLRQSTIRITVDPNHFTYLEVPVYVMGEVSGTVYLDDKGSRNGLGRIVVHIYNSDSILVAKTITETDGFFSYLGLAPGNYTIKIDPEQLKKLNMESRPQDVNFTIRKMKEGDAVGNVTFTISYIKKDGDSKKDQ